MIQLKKSMKEYLNERGISDFVLEDSLISFNDYRNKIVIPVLDKNKKVLFNKYRKNPFANDDVTPKYTYDSGSKATLFNLHTIKDKTQPVVITEGEFDALCLTSAGIQAVSSTGGCGTFPIEWVSELDGYDVYICYDRDKAGIQGALRVQKLFPTAKIIMLPDFDGKDITDYTKEFGLANFLKLKAETWLIPTGKKAKEYNDLANKALYFQRQNPDYVLYTQTIIDTTLKDRDANVRKKKKIYNLSEGSTDITKAKQVPIDSMIEFSADGFARCIWHHEVHGSMKYYKKDNRVHCFGGCGKGGDAVDVAKKLYNLSTIEAIKYLNR